MADNPNPDDDDVSYYQKTVSEATFLNSNESYIIFICVGF